MLLYHTTTSRSSLMRGTRRGCVVEKKDSPAPLAIYQFWLLVQNLTTRRDKLLVGCI